jgi:hypothetical protein
MAKLDVGRALQSDLDAPGSLKSGEYLEERILWTVRRAVIAGDREGVVEVMRDWLLLRREPQTMLAVTAIMREHLTELVLEIEALRMDVLTGSVFPRFYLGRIDEALSSVKSSMP